AVPPDLAGPIAEAIGRKDEAEVEERIRSAGGDPRLIVQLLRAPTLEDGLALLERTPAEGAARRLEALHHAARDRGLGERVTADLGEIRSAAYYTGMVFRA